MMKKELDGDSKCEFSVIFLDIDGVLDVFNRNEFLQTILDDAVIRLKKIVGKTQAKIVVISNWRYGSDQFREMSERTQIYPQECANWKLLEPALAKQDLAVYDVSPWENELKTRGDEIRCYLSRHPDIRQYVILDDCFAEDYSRYDELKENLILIDANKGLQDEDVNRAIAKLL